MSRKGGKAAFASELGRTLSRAMKPTRRRIGRTVKRTTTQTAHFFQDVTRFVDRHYVIAKASELFYKSVKRRISQFMFFATTFFIGGRALAGQEVHLSQVGALAAVAGLIAYGFQWWANKVLQRNVEYAQSHGVNLLKDRKKSRFIKQLGALWEAVYAPEAATLFSQAHRHRAAAEIARIKKTILEKHQQNILPAQDAGAIEEIVRFDLGYALSNSEESYALLDKEGFCAAVEYELRTFHPQNVQLKRLGFSIAQLEDLLDGATLTRNDTKLLEQRAHFSIREIAACAASQLPLRRHVAQQIRHAWSCYCQTFWQHNIALSVEASVGSLLYELHNKYQTGLIDAQDVIWQEKEALGYVEHQLLDTAPAIIDEIKCGTKRIIRKIFSRHKEDARRLVVRMYGYNIRHGIHLLMSYDSHYATNRLSRSPRDDMGIITTNHKELESVAAAMQAASRNMACFHAFAALHRDRLQPYGREEKRAFETAYYINHKGLRQKLAAMMTSCNQASDEITGLLEEIAEHKSVFTHRLRTLRLHKELAILEFEDILEHVQYLGDL